MLGEGDKEGVVEGEAPTKGEVPAMLGVGVMEGVAERQLEILTGGVEDREGVRVGVGVGEDVEVGESLAGAVGEDAWVNMEGVKWEEGESLVVLEKEGVGVLAPSWGERVELRVSVRLPASLRVTVGGEGDKVETGGVREGEGMEVRVSPSVGPAWMVAVMVGGMVKTCVEVAVTEAV